MGNLVLWSLAFVITWLVLVALGVVMLRWRLQRANRVSPATRSPAPLTWLWLPTQPARLHRRLRDAVEPIHLAPARRGRATATASASPTVDDLRRDLEYQAIELDHHLVVASRHPRTHRRSLLAELATQVGEVERLSIRLSRLSRPPGVARSGWEPADPPEVLARLSHQLDLLDQAQDELAQIERAAGLVDVEALLAPVSPPPAQQPARHRPPPP